MIDRIAQLLDYTVCAEIALVMFAAVFVVILVRTLRTSRAASSRQARLPLDDGTQRKSNG